MIPPTDQKNLLDELADISMLEKAWKIVRRSALQSKSRKIVELAKEFDQESTKNLTQISRDLRDGSFHFPGVFPRLMPRKGKRPRPLAVAPIPSRIVQRALLDLLWKNPTIQDYVRTRYSFGGIEERSVRDALAHVARCVDDGYRYYISSDISDFFQSVKRDEVQQIIFSSLRDETINDILEKAITCEIINSNKEHIQKYIDLFPKDEIGVIQGCCLSPLYGNIFLSDFDTSMNEMMDVVCIRYIDDFLVLSKNEKQLLNAFDIAVNLLEKKGLTVYKLDQENTKARKADITKRPIEFLGCSIEKGRVRPLRKAKEKLLEKIDGVFNKSIEEMKRSKFETPIINSYLVALMEINNIIKGWSGAYSFCNDRSYFTSLDQKISEKLAAYTSKINKMRQSKELQNPLKRQRLLGVQLSLDATGVNTLW